MENVFFFCMLTKDTFREFPTDVIMKIMTSLIITYFCMMSLIDSFPFHKTRDCEINVNCINKFKFFSQIALSFHCNQRQLNCVWNM